MCGQTPAPTHRTCFAADGTGVRPVDRSTAGAAARPPQRPAPPVPAPQTGRCRAAPYAGATQEVTPPGWKGGPSCSDQRRARSWTVEGRAAIHARRAGPASWSSSAAWTRLLGSSNPTTPTSCLNRRVHPAGRTGRAAPGHRRAVRHERASRDRLTAWLRVPRPSRLTAAPVGRHGSVFGDRKSTRLNSSHEWISYAVFCLKKKKMRVVTDWTVALLFRRDIAELGMLGHTKRLGDE